MAIKKNTTDQHEEVNWPYGKKNYIYFAAAIIVIIVGFFTLSQGSETLAPVLLVIGYLIMIPVSLIVKDDAIEAQKTDSEITD